MSSFFLFLFNATLVNNIVLTYLVGVDLQVASGRRMDVAWFTGLSTLLCLCILLPVIYLVRNQIVIPLAIEYLDLLIYMLITIVVVLVIQKLFHQLFPSSFQQINAIVPLIFMNSILFAIILLQETQVNSFTGSFLFGLATGLGFLFLLLVITCLRERIDNANVPKPFQGLPIILITFGMLSMGLMGLSGLK